MEKEFEALARNADRDLRDEGWQGTIHRQRSVDLRYRGQGHELNLPFSRRVLDEFGNEHERRYGYRYADREFELVTLRLRATVKSPPLNASSSERSRNLLGAGRSAGVVNSVPVSFSAKKLKTPVYARESLNPGTRNSGPAVVTEYSATTVVPPGTRFWLDRSGNLIIKVSG